jgi:hypothetical protein
MLRAVNSQGSGYQPASHLSLQHETCRGIHQDNTIEFALVIDLKWNFIQLQDQPGSNDGKSRRMHVFHDRVYFDGALKLLSTYKSIRSFRPRGHSVLRDGPDA